MDSMQIKKGLENDQLLKARKEGILERLMDNLKNEFQVDSVDKANRKHARIRKELDDNEILLDNKQVEFTEKYPELVE